MDAGRRPGEGRNAIFLAERRFRVRAFDCSEAAIAKLRRRAATRRVDIEAWVGDLADFELDRSYGVIVATGVSQFVSTELGIGPGGIHHRHAISDLVARRPSVPVAPYRTGGAQ